MKYKLLVVDDEVAILTMLKEYFEILGYEIYTAQSADEAKEKLVYNPDLILLDVNMPQVDGITLCKQIRNEVSVPIVFLTAKIEEQDRINGLMAGGDDYIMKPFSMEELHARIVAHLRREERAHDKKKICAAGEFIINFTDRTVSIGDKKMVFTKTEYEIIELLCSNKGRIFDKERIYEHLWGFDKDGDSAIITEHIRRIRCKFEKESEHKMIETVWGVGYRWIG